MMELRPASTEARALSTFGVRNDGSIPRTGRRRIGNVDPRTIRLVTALGTALVLSEAVTLALGPTVGLLAQALVLSALLGLSMRQGPGPHQRLTLALALLPLVRILSLALPAAIIPIVFWYLEIGLAAFEAILLVMRRLDLAFRDLGVRRAPVGEIVSVGVVGAVLALPAYLIVGPIDLGQGGGFVGFAVASAVVIVFVGVLEELLFRGLIQSAGTQLLSRGGVLLSVSATALMYSASLNPRYVVFATLVATFFGIVARRSGSIAAPVAGHAALAWVQFVVLPMILP
jgi:membrane protease YdiL (CAAX protease family)